MHKKRDCYSLTLSSNSALKFVSIFGEHPILVWRLGSLRAWRSDDWAVCMSDSWAGWRLGSEQCVNLTAWQSVSLMADQSVNLTGEQSARSLTARQCLPVRTLRTQLGPTVQCLAVAQQWTRTIANAATPSAVSNISLTSTLNRDDRF